MRSTQTPDELLRTMRLKFYAALAFGTLAIDVYLALVSVATRMISGKNAAYLLPFASDGVSDGERILMLVVAGWTAVLAIGCLKASDPHNERPFAPGPIWFVVVLVVIWLSYIIPLVVAAFWNLFVYGP